jgi:hypothetical protein
MRIPRVVIRSTTAEVKHAELHGVVTVGPESAKLLSEKLGREVKVGETFDLGALAVYDKSFWRRLKANVKIAIAHSKSPFRTPLKKDET